MKEQERNIVESIREEYAPREDNDFDKLRSLDRKVRMPAEALAYVLGVLGALVLGVGMCIALQAIAAPVALGIVVGVAGIAIVSVNYPIYRAVLNARKRKYASRVLELGDKLLNK